MCKQVHHVHSGPLLDSLALQTLPSITITNNIRGIRVSGYQEVLFKLQEANSQGLLLRHPVIMEGWVGNARLYSSIGLI